MVRSIKAQRIRWIEHIVSVDEERTVERITVWRPVAVRGIGRPKLRWEGDGCQRGSGKNENSELE